MNPAAPQTVLVIDDEYYVRDSIAAYLEDVGYRVLKAVNGQDGLEVFRREMPDVVLTDLRMPLLDGFGLLEVVRAEAPFTPIVVVSGLGALDEAIRAGVVNNTATSGVSTNRAGTSASPLSRRPE